MLDSLVRKEWLLVRGKGGALELLKALAAVCALLAARLARKGQRRSASLLLLVGLSPFGLHWLQQHLTRLRIDAAVRSSPIPRRLLAALKSRDAVVLLGDDFEAPVGHAMGLQEAVAEVAKEMQTEAGSIAADCQPTLSEAENMLGRVAASSSQAVWPRCAARAKGIWTRHSALGSRRAAALADVPFTAILSLHRGSALAAEFPHVVTRNFGGFAAVLSKPRVDASPGRSRPFVQLWPGLWNMSGTRRTRELQGNVRPPDDCGEEIDDDAPYMAFLRDTFRSKVPLFCAWRKLPPEGHVGRALSAAWSSARKADVDRKEPLAYAASTAALAPAMIKECYDSFGLEVLVLASNAGSDSTLERFLEYLAEACAAET